VNKKANAEARLPHSKTQQKCGCRAAKPIFARPKSIARPDTASYPAIGAIEAFAKYAISLIIRKILVGNTGVFYRRVAKNAHFANASIQAYSRFPGCMWHDHAPFNRTVVDAPRPPLERTGLS